MSVNKGLFAKTGKIFREKNLGICQNYVDALKHVAGKRSKYIIRFIPPSSTLF